MILYIVRHGAPDYETDTLLPEGIEQAQLVAKRLQKSRIDEIHSSPQGRAMETAQPLAELLGLPVIVEPWAYELHKEDRVFYPPGEDHALSRLPATVLHAPEMLGVDVEEGFRTLPIYKNAGYVPRYHAIAAGLDAMLEKLGYRRSFNGFYDAVAPNDRHVALFCHGGMTRAMLSWLFHILPHLIGEHFVPHFTGITAISFSEEKGSREVPFLLSLGDVGHLYTDEDPLRHATHFYLKKQF